jgi:hypothetical protein
MSDNIVHSGIKGMKWGVRRYQNKDGSLTPAGKKRYDRDTSELSDKKKAKYKADPDKWVKEDLEGARRLSDETSNMARKLKDVNDSSMRNRPKIKMDLSSMTDQQMRNEINRALLERQYNDLFAPQKVSKGKQVMSKILDGTVATLGIASSALGIALAIKQLKG